MNIKKIARRLLLLLYCILFVASFSGCIGNHAPDIDETFKEQETGTSVTITEDGIYSSKDDVALYIHTFNHLPSNYITKKEARDLGWKGGGLDDVAYGKCIGGDGFLNREGLLPKKKKRKYYECDIDTLHEKKRGEKRIIYSNDGLIYYTEDHYSSYELLYGDP